MVEKYLERIFALFNRRPTTNTFEEYLTFLEDYDDELIIKLFYHVRDHHTAFPSIAQLKKDLKGLQGRRAWSSMQHRDPNHACYYCDDVGLVPYLQSPKKDTRLTRYTIFMQRCKCELGQEYDKNIPLHSEIQFEANEDVNYPTLVQVNMNKFNKKLNEMTK